MLVHIAGGGEESVTNIALVWPAGVYCGSQSLLQDPVHSLHVHIQVARLRVRAATNLALVRPLLAV